MAKVTIRLERDDFEEILEWLGGRRDSYEFTAEFLEDSDNPNDAFIEEVTDSREAQKIAARFKRIINQISQQLDE